MPSFLPLEVWFNVLEYATLVPNAFDTHAPHAFAYPGPLSQEEIQSGIRASLCTKRRIALVCRAWNSYGTRLLYQAIPITRSTTFDKVLRTLRVCENTSSDTPCEKDSIGHSTIRLDLIWKRGEYLHRNDLDELLRYLPNVQIIFFRGPFLDSCSDKAVSFFDVLEMHTLPNLKVLDFCSFDYTERNYTLDAISGRHLRVLRIRPTSLSLWMPRTISLPEIECLDAPPQLLRPILTGETPSESLSHLCVGRHYDTSWKVAVGRLSGIGTHLTSVEIYTHPVTSVIQHLSFPEPSTIFRKLAEACPELLELIINLGKHESLSGVDYLPPVKRLGLRFCSSDASKNFFRQLGEDVVRLALLTSSLKVVRILSKPSSAHLKDHQAGAYKIARRVSSNLLLEQGIHFEDCTGHLFHDGETRGHSKIAIVGQIRSQWWPIDSVSSPIACEQCRFNTFEMAKSIIYLLESR